MRPDDVRAEHEAAVRAFGDAIAAVSADRWHEPLGAGRWSPAAVALHVVRAYEFGSDAADGGAGMRLRVPPIGAWVGRRILLPLMLATGRFPRGAEAPSEVVPDLAAARALGADDAIARLRVAGDRACARLLARDGDPHAPRVTHAYFGTLAPRQALRLLSAHTLHHARGLRGGA